MLATLIVEASFASTAVMVWEAIVAVCREGSGGEIVYSPCLSATSMSDGTVKVGSSRSLYRVNRN